MVTLAVASAFAILAAQLSDFTGGEDGRSFRVPEMLRPGYTPGRAAAARHADHRPRRSPTTSSSCAALALFLAALRIVNSPFGRVLQAIRENDFRAEALGYRTVYYRTAANCLAAAMAVLAGALNALWLRYTGPDTTLSFAIMLDILLMVVIGGMGTMYGAVIGATLFIVAQNYLQKLMGAAVQGHRGAAAAAEPAAPRPLAAVARHPVRAQRLLLPDRHRRAAAPTQVIARSATCADQSSVSCASSRR